jgi:hypothetical protein
VAAGKITAKRRLGMHAFNCRGIADPKSNRREKQDASGHKTEPIIDIYDLSVPLVEPAG